MQYFTIVVVLVLLLIAIVSAQWDNSYWWYNQQRPQAQNWFGNSGYQSDDKGNMWHGSDNAKLMIFAKSSWP